MAQTKADRSAAAKKAAATRERNAQRTQSEAAGKKAAATRQERAAGRAANQAANQAMRAASGVASGVKSAIRLSGVAAREGAKAAATRAGALGQDRKR